MYGYKIINGKAVINEQEAEVIANIFDCYVSGLSMKKAAEGTGVDFNHSTVKRILSQDRYTGNDYYPAIISREVFAKANGRRLHRASMHNCEKRYTPPPIYTEFSMAEPTLHFDDPIKQAEYVYSLIEVKR